MRQNYFAASKVQPEQKKKKNENYRICKQRNLFQEIV